VDNLGLFEMTTMRPYTMLYAATVFSMVACAGALPKAQTSVFPNGTYEFYEHTQAITTDLSGRLEIVGDSVKMLDTSPMCIEDRVPIAGARVQTFKCGEFALSASRETGRWQFRFATQHTVESVVETCINWDTVNGRQVCKATTKERREHVIPVSGTLRLTPINAESATRAGVP
jgi:hypothetical protein